MQENFGYAKEVKDNIPAGLEFLPNNETNKAYGWRMLDENGKETGDPSKAKEIVTDYLSKAKEKTAGSNLIKAFDKTTGKLDYRDLKIVFKVSQDFKPSDGIIKNIAEIKENEDENGRAIKDRDSTPNNLSTQNRKQYSWGESERGKGYEDDDDVEIALVKGKYFDLALREFIIAINEKELKTQTAYDREPIVDTTPLNNGTSTTAIYKHKKSPVTIAPGNIVTYVIRIYNEGNIDGYADEITEHLPPELEFINNDFNAANGWVLDTNDTTQRTLKTTLLSAEKDKENIIKGFDNQTLNYKDIKSNVKF